MIEFIKTYGFQFDIINLSDFTTDYDLGIKLGDRGWVVSDDLEELIKYTAKTSIDALGSIKPKDKVFICKHCGFPPMLLSRLSSSGVCDLKRTIKQSAADICVSDECVKDPITYTWRQYRATHPSCIYIDAASKSIKIANMDYKTSGDKVATAGLYKTMKEHYTKDVYYGVYYDNIEFLEYAYNNASKVVKTSNLMAYVQNLCAKPSDSEWESLMATIQSVDPEQSKLGWDMLQYYNLSDRYLELFNILRLMGTNYQLPTESARSASMKYVTEQIGVSYYNICHNYYTNPIPPIRVLELLNNPLASSETKSKAFTVLKGSIRDCITSSYRTKLAIVGLRIEVKVKDGSSIIENPSYAETQVITEVMHGISNNTSLAVVNKALSDYNLQVSFVRNYDA